MDLFVILCFFFFLRAHAIQIPVVAYLNTKPKSIYIYTTSTYVMDKCKRRVNKMAIRRSAFVIIMAAVLLSTLVGVASAVSHSWYMLGTGTDAPEGVDYWMQKGSGSSGVSAALGPGAYATWGADESVSVNQVDMAGQWDVHVYLWVSSMDAISVTVDIGRLNSSGTFIVAAGKEKTLPICGSHNHWWNTTEINPTSFPISNGESLAVRVTNNDNADSITVVATGTPTNSPSYIASPDSDPGYPVPELPTIVLTSLGVLLLVGFVAYSRRRNIK